MRKFSAILESQGTVALQQEITNFLNKLKKKIPQKVQSAIAITQRLNLTTSEELDAIKDARKTELKKLALKMELPLEDITILRELLNELRNDIKLMPQYMTNVEREALIKGKMSIADATMDFDSRVGRNVIAKMYMPLAIKIAGEFVQRNGSPKLNKQDYLGACLEALSEGINNYRDEIKDKGLTMTFGAYIKKKMNWACLELANKHGSDFSGTYSKAFTDARDAGNTSDFFADSIDNYGPSNGDDIQHDRIAALGVHQDHKPKQDEALELLFNGIEKKFSQRDCDIFYRYFGINDRDKEKGGDIAKRYGVSNGVVTQTVTKIIKYIKNDKKMEDTLEILRDMFTESLLYDLRMMKASMITEALESDDVYILFEELFRFKSKNAFIKAFKNASKVSDISDILVDFKTIDAALKLRKKDIVAFLSALYPSENISTKSDVEILEMLQDILKLYKKHINENKEESGESIKSLDDLKELMRAKFKEVFGDKLDKERMEFTIKGFLKDNKEDVDNKEWGKLAGKFNQSFAVKESFNVVNDDALCRIYNTFWGTPTDSVMYMINGVYCINNVPNFEELLYNTHIGNYYFKQSGFVNLAVALQHFNVGWMRCGSKIVLQRNTEDISMGAVRYTVNDINQDPSALGISTGIDIDSYSKELRSRGVPVRQVGECLVCNIGNSEVIIEAQIERMSFPELEEMLREKIGELYIIKGRRGYRIASDEKGWTKALKTPFNYLPSDFDKATPDEQFNMVKDVIVTIS